MTEKRNGALILLCIVLNPGKSKLPWICYNRKFTFAKVTEGIFPFPCH